MPAGLVGLEQEMIAKGIPLPSLETRLSLAANGVSADEWAKSHDEWSKGPKCEWTGPDGLRHVGDHFGTEREHVCSCGCEKWTYDEVVVEDSEGNTKSYKRPGKTTARWLTGEERAETAERLDKIRKRSEAMSLQAQNTQRLRRRRQREEMSIDSLRRILYKTALDSDEAGNCEDVEELAEILAKKERSIGPTTKFSIRFHAVRWAKRQSPWVLVVGAGCSIGGTGAVLAEAVIRFH